MTSTVAVLGDIHANSKVGLCPPVVNMFKGGTYRPPRPQLWLHSKFLEYRDEGDDGACGVGRLQSVA